MQLREWLPGSQDAGQLWQWKRIAHTEARTIARLNFVKQL